MVGFLKKGEDAQNILKQEEAKQALAESQKGAYRFWLPKGSETQITFVDGDLDEFGNFATPMFYEHNLKINGRWGNTFVCTSSDEPCPICEEGTNAYTAAVFTIIDHSTYTSKKDGKDYSDQIKLLVVKAGTRKDLLRLATKRGGLAGCTFDVSRKNEDKSPAVGDLFDFCQKLTPEQMEKKWEKKAVPLNYAEEITYLTADEIRSALGSSTPAAMATSANTKSYGDDL